MNTTTADLLDRIPAHMAVRYAPLEDGDTSTRVLHVADKAQSGYVPILVIPYTYTDATGYNEAVALANRRWIEDYWIGEGTGDHLIEVTSAFAGSEYALRLDTLPELPDEEAEDAVDTVVRLYDYSLFAVDSLQEVEAEIIADAWNDYLVVDTKRELSQDVRDHADACVDDDVADALRAALDEVGAYPCVDGESAYVGHYDLKAVVPAWERRIRALKDLDGNAFTPVQD